MTLLAMKRRLWRWSKRLGLLLLLRSLGLVLTILFCVGLGLIGLKFIYVTQFNGFDFFQLSTLVKYIQYYMYVFLSRWPYLWSVWNLIPIFNLKNPITLLTDGWMALLGLFSLALLGKHMLNRKVEEDIMQSSINIYRDVGVMNTGTMTIKKVESIAAHLTRISSPAESQVARAIAALTKAVHEEPSLDDSTRSEVLDQLGELARQTALPEADRSKGVYRPIMKALDTALNTAGNLAGVWSAFGGTIKEFFGIQ
jgi:hypothetical protein